MATDYKIRLKRFNGTDYDTLNLVSSNVVMDNGDTLQNKLENYSRPNLLDNWYFVGGGSQLGNGIFPINQRGQTSYSGGRGIDRWTSDNGMTVSSGYIQTTSGAIYQTGNNVAMNPLMGKTLTGTVLAYDGNLYTGTITLPSTYPESTTVYNFYNANEVYIGIALYPEGGGQLIRFNVGAIAVKLEFGSTQTLAHQENGTWVLNEIPNFEEQLILCNTAKTDSTDTYANKVVAYAPEKASVTISSSSWSGSNPYTQTVSISGAVITSKTKVDIQPDATALAQLISDGVTALYISNNNGVLTLYAIGAATTVNVTVQVTYYETV